MSARPSRKLPDRIEPATAIAKLIPVGTSNIGDAIVQTTSARDLHVFLKVGKDFSTWAKAQIARARLVEGRDFVSSPSRGSSGQHIVEYHLTLEAGKHVAMLSETEKGFEVREYFIECERRALTAPTKRSSRAAQSLLSDAKAIDFIGNMVAKVPGARADVVATIKLRMIEERTGLPATQFGTALPAEALDKAVKLNPTEIGRRLVPKLSPIRVNKILIDLAMQRKSESGYILTAAGAAHGESRPFQAENHHVGDQINWYESIVDVVREAIKPPPPNAQGTLGIE